MSDRSAIEWTDATWNPVRGCTKVSPGCKFCYAELFAERFRGVPGHPFEQGFDLRLVPEKLDQPLHWRRPRKIFVNSMSDLFHEDVPPDYIGRVGDVMRRADWLVFQVLTKRDERLRELLRGELRWMADLEHVAFGVSVEDRRYGIPRIRSLQETPARIRFLSVEPLLADLGQLNLRGIDWVIVGGESGPHARPMLRDWVVSIRRQCRAQRVPFFFKQWGGTRDGPIHERQLVKQVRAWGLTNRRGKPLTSQAIGVLLRNQLYAGIVDVPEYGVRGKRGEFAPPVNEDDASQTRRQTPFSGTARISAPVVRRQIQ